MKFKDFLKKNGNLMLIHSLELWGLFLLGYAELHLLRGEGRMKKKKP